MLKGKSIDLDAYTNVWNFVGPRSERNMSRSVEKARTRRLHKRLYVDFE